MKRMTGVFCGFFTVFSLCSAEFDKGGVTFPMEKISAERFGTQEGTQENLLKNSDLSAPLVRSAADGWNSGIWIFGQENRDKFNAEAGKLATAKIVDTEDGKALELNRPPELETLMGKASDKFTIGFKQTVKLPDENGGTYRLAFDSRNQVIGQNRYDQMVLLNFHDGSDPRREGVKQHGITFTAKSAQVRSGILTVMSSPPRRKHAILQSQSARTAAAGFRYET